MQLQHRITKFFGKHSTGMLFLIPAVTLNAVFFIYPLFRVVQMSFYNWTVLGTSQYLALGNYERLFVIPFWKLSNTLIYTIIVTPGILSQRLLWPCFSTTLEMDDFFRTVYFMPVAISFVVANLVFLWIYNELYDTQLCTKWLDLYAHFLAWNSSVDGAVFRIPHGCVEDCRVLHDDPSLRDSRYSEACNEAADLDGVSFWQRFMYITFPIIRSTFVLALLVSSLALFWPLTIFMS